jgi:NADH-quinone oxidoreductase subunit N
VIASALAGAATSVAAINPSLPAPKIDYWLALPMLIVFGTAMVSVLVEAFAPRGMRYAIQLVVSIGGLIAAFVAVVKAANGHKGSTASGSIVVDGPTLFLQGTLIILSILAVLTMAERYSEGPSGDSFTPQGASIPGSPHEAAAVRAKLVTTEVFPLTLFAVGGMMLFPAAGDLLTMFVALEVLSLPLYVLCGLARRRRLLSQEASLKYFLLGAFSSAFFLFGSALLFGYAGSLNLGDIAKAITEGRQGQGLLLPGIALVGIGLLFKVGAVPFHSWTPDVYQGAPTPVTGFMAACTKIAAFGAILRVVYVGVAGARWDWQPVIWAVAIVTMLAGSILAITQTDVKRMLAYSSIAHAGFVLVGVLAFDKTGVTGVLFYLAAYGFSTIGAFAVVSLVRDSAGEATHLSQWAGLGKKHPLVAGIFALFLLAFAGIPLTSGFTAKFAVFAPAIAHGAVWLAVVGVVSSAIAAFFYVRVIVLMYFSEPSGDATTVAIPSAATTVALTIGVAMTVLLGVFPQPVLDLAAHSSVFVP